MSAEAQIQSETFPNERPTPRVGTALLDLVAALSELTGASA